MELLEMELIKKLQESQDCQKEAFGQLEEILVATQKKQPMPDIAYEFVKGHKAKKGKNRDSL